MIKTKTKNKKGFTLIELLIVVLIISILAGLLLTVINPTGVRKKTRDAQRKTDIKRIQTALELYFADNRQYPTTNGAFAVAGVGNSPGQINYELTNGKYLSVVPRDPLYNEPSEANSQYSSSTGGCSDDMFDYSYKSDGNVYILMASTEMESSAEESMCNTISNTVNNCYDLSNPTPKCYGVQNP